MHVLLAVTLLITKLAFSSASPQKTASPTEITAIPGIPLPSPVVPLGGQCGGLTYKGPTGCEQIKGEVVACVYIDPYLSRCEIIKPTVVPTITLPPKPTKTCTTSTLACSASCKILCPTGQHLTGTACPFCTCETPVPLCPKPTESCISSTLSCDKACAIACKPPAVLTGSSCPFCECVVPTAPLCSTPKPSFTRF